MGAPPIVRAFDPTFIEFSINLDGLVHEPPSLLSFFLRSEGRPSALNRGSISLLNSEEEIENKVSEYPICADPLLSQHETTSKHLSKARKKRVSH